MNTIKIPEEYNYIGVFLTLACNLHCSYCINLMDYNRGELAWQLFPMNADEWIKALNRIEATEALPITIQGGEPTVHPGFYDIINNVHKPMDLLTNGQFNIQEFTSRIKPEKFKRNAPYASIRISYHPEQMTLANTVFIAKYLKDKHYQVGVWMVEHPEWKEHTREAKKEFEKAGVEFKTKEFLGLYKGKRYGTIKYPLAVDDEPKECMCRTTELLVAPDGQVHRCHSDLYNLRKGVGHILHPHFQPVYTYHLCKWFGTCNECDVKVTTNRFQQFGHTSVEIERI